MLPNLIAFCASFVFIFLKAFQQLNVVHKQYLLVIPTSMAMSVCEIGVVALVIKQALPEGNDYACKLLNVPSKCKENAQTQQFTGQSVCCFAASN